MPAEEPDYIRLNRANWDDRAVAHVEGGGYNLSLWDDPAHLSQVVRFDLPRLGDITGLDVVHLQCHIGTDTLSLARLGASRVTGVDFSPNALERAAALSQRAGIPNADWVLSDVYNAPSAVGRQVDLVYTGIGAIGWLPSIDRWAGILADLVKPAGRFFMREGHPVLFALCEPRRDREITLEFPYFEQEQPIVWDEDFTYVPTDHVIEHTVMHEWNHALGEIITSLLDHGFRLDLFVEHDSVPWDFLPGQTVQLPNEEWQLADRPERLPHSYTVGATRLG